MYVYSLIKPIYMCITAASLSLSSAVKEKLFSNFLVRQVNRKKMSGYIKCNIDLFYHML